MIGNRDGMESRCEINTSETVTLIAAHRASVSTPLLRLLCRIVSMKVVATSYDKAAKIGGCEDKDCSRLGAAACSVSVHMSIWVKRHRHRNLSRSVWEGSIHLIPTAIGR